MERQQKYNSNWHFSGILKSETVLERYCVNGMWKKKKLKK